MSRKFPGKKTSLEFAACPFWAELRVAARARRAKVLGQPGLERLERVLEGSLGLGRRAEAKAGGWLRLGGAHGDAQSEGQREDGEHGARVAALALVARTTCEELRLASSTLASRRS